LSHDGGLALGTASSPEAYSPEGDCSALNFLRKKTTAHRLTQMHHARRVAGTDERKSFYVHTRNEEPGMHMVSTASAVDTGE